MGKRALTWWESLPARRQFICAVPFALVVLFGFHEAFFPLLHWPRSLSYAVMECVPIALVIVFATQTELKRRAGYSDDQE